MQTEIMGKITDLDWDFWCILKAATGHQKKKHVSFNSSFLFFFQYTLWLFNIAMENDPFIDDVPIRSDAFPWQSLF